MEMAHPDVQRFQFLTWLLFIVLVASGPAVHAQSQVKQSALRSLRGASAPSSSEDFNSIRSTFDRILKETDSAYDGFTLATLRRMQSEANPQWDPAGINPELSRHMAERVFSIQAGHDMAKALRSSELKDTYRDVVSSLLGLQDALRFTVRSTGSSIRFDRRARGKKLFELGVEFNFRQVVDPQLRIGHRMRFRYDYAAKRPILEYAFSF